MTRDDILTREDVINSGFMSWLWNRDREKYSFIMFGHLELITDELLAEWKESEANNATD